MIRLATRHVPALVALTALAAALQLGVVRGARGDDPCRSPDSLRATTLIPGSAALGERLELLTDATFQWSEGEIENPVFPKQPMRFQVVRTYDTSWLTENTLEIAAYEPKRRGGGNSDEEGARLQPEELREVEVPSNAGGVPVHIAWDHTASRVLLDRPGLSSGPSRLAAWFFVFDNRAVGSPVREQLRSAPSLAVGGTRPVTLVVVSAVATEATLDRVERAATEWLARAWEFTARSCRAR